jgi:hypothetical protein
MAIISFGNINKKILFAIFGGIFKLLSDLIVKFLRKSKKIEIREHPFILGINAGLGYCISFIPFLIFKRNYDYLNQKTFDVDEKLIYNETDDYFLEKREKKFRPWLIIAFCDFFQKLLSFIYISLYNFWIFDILFILIFSHFILKMKLYKHHFISLMLIIIFGIIINIIYNIYEEISEEFFFKILNTSIIEIIFSLQIVVAKYAMEYKLSSPYEICLFEGVFLLVINLILLIIFTFIPMSEIKYIKNTKYEGKMYIDNFFQYFSKISYIEVISFIIIMLGRFGFNIFCLLIIKYFTPSHSIIILIIGEVYFAFNDLEPLWRVFIEYFIYALLIFVMLVFLEIIEINLWGLQKNTERNISLRAGQIESIMDDVETEEEKEDE